MMVAMLDEKNGGYYPCTGLDEEFVCTGTPSVRPGVCVIAAGVTCNGIPIRSATLARWCAAPRSRCVHLDVRYHCVRQYVVTPIHVAMRESSRPPICAPARNVRVYVCSSRPYLSLWYLTPCKSMYVFSVCTAEEHNRWSLPMHRRGRKRWRAPAHRITSRWLLSMHRHGRVWWCAPAHRITRRWLLSTRRGRQWWCAPAPA